MTQSVKPRQLSNFVVNLAMDFSKMNLVGPQFDKKLYFQAREKTKQAVEEIASRVEPGFTEAMGHQLIEDVLKSKGYEKFWHPHKFRIGKNTICSFRDKSDPETQLANEDIFFIDIGPIFENHEGDYGKTFQLGDNPSHKSISQRAEALFKLCEKEWQEKGLSGVDLYEFARIEAEKMGYVLEDRMCGHRLGEFPHALHYKGRMNQVEQAMCADLWVLEILILDPQKRFGAFYEDILQKP